MNKKLYSYEKCFYESFEKTRYILTSRIKTKILISLYQKKKKLNAIRSDLNKPSATILHGIKELEKMNFVKKLDKYYLLSSKGCLITLNMIKLIENWHSIKLNVDFWKNHDIAIPPEFLRRNNLFKKAKCIKSYDTDLTKPLTEYINLVSKSNSLKILLPIFSKIHLDVILESLDNSCNIELITTENILKSIYEEGYNFKLFKDKNKDHLKVWKVENDLKIFMTCCEEFLSLNLFFEDGCYDDSTILINKTEESVKWGFDLFNYYKKRGKKINFPSKP